MTTSTLERSCDPAVATTRSLLGWGVVAGPLFVTVSLAQALRRDGFDLRRHAWSVLENGQLGWIQSTNFVLTGAMVVACAVGLRRATGARWASRLLAGFGVGTALAGVFTADPVAGFPAGTTSAAVSWHGMLHLAFAGLGFLGMIAACLILARRFGAEGRRGWAVSARITGLVFLAAFAGITTGATAAVLPFVFAVVLAYGWLAALAAHLYSSV
jgi:hypothetical membrane protein